MSKRKKNIEEFFTTYEEHFNNAISSEHAGEEEIGKYFADCFIESSPLGVQCGRNDKQFLERTRQGYAFYREIGSKGMHIVSREITLLDDFHAMVKVYWRYTYQKDEREGFIDFNVFYIVSAVNQEIKIIAYITGNEQQALKEAGLVQEMVIPS
jgi:hypothetical protein